MDIIDPALADLAAAQHGVFCSRQAHGCGMSDQDLSRLARSGGVVRLGQGAYALPSVLESADPTARYVVTVRAVVLARAVPSWASHHAALTLLGLPVVDLTLGLVDVASCVVAPFRSQGVRVGPLPDGEPCQEVGGTPAVSATTAVIQVAARSVRAGLVAADACVHSGRSSIEQLRARADELALGPRQRRMVAAALGAVDPASESPGESLSRLLLKGIGVALRSQVVLRDQDGVIARVDFLVDERVVVEFDGLVKYEGAQGRSALAAEKLREDRLRAAGYEVVRLTWADLRQPERVARAVREAQHRARSRTPG